MKKLTVKAAKFFLVLLIPSMFLFSCEDDSIDLGGRPESATNSTVPKR
jgi:hypothetical protein